jgi:cell division protein FtsI (penicillin-binding protein 3)
MQTLAFYNVANNGVMVKPQFVSEIKEEQNHCKMEKEVINPRYVHRNTFKVESSFKKCSEKVRQNSTQRIFQWQVKQVRRLNYAKDGGSGNICFIICGLFSGRSS